MTIPSIRDVNVKGKRVLVRVDFNVSVTGDSEIANDNRIREAVPTIQYLIRQKATVVLLSHLGRPKGGPDPALSLSCVAKRLGELLKRDITFVDNYIEP